VRGRVRAERTVIAEALERAFYRAEQQLQRGPRVSRTSSARRNWLATGLREFTLRIPGDMNREPASDGDPVPQNVTPNGVVGAHE
jgi:hypothetical protein